jgi:hypothetical protein
MRGQERLIQAYGLREIATGVGILASKDPTPWIWGRVAGDALDLATLATAVEKRNNKEANVGIAMAAVAGVTALDIYCAKALSSESTTPLPPLRDYSDRSGLPKPPHAMRGVARRDFETPPTCGPTFLSRASDTRASSPRAFGRGFRRPRALRNHCDWTSFIPQESARMRAADKQSVPGRKGGSR